MDLHNTEKQLILYAKNHFGRIDYGEDLKYFAARLYGLDPEQVEIYMIRNMVIELYQKLISGGYLSFQLKAFMNGLFKRSWREKGRHEIDHSLLLRELLGDIQGMKVKDIELGETDKSILQNSMKHLLNS